MVLRSMAQRWFLQRARWRTGREVGQSDRLIVEKTLGRLRARCSDSARFTPSCIRKSRLKAPPYHPLAHCVSRVLDRKFVLGPEEKEEFMRLCCAAGCATSATGRCWERRNSSTASSSTSAIASAPSARAARDRYDTSRQGD